MKKCRVGLTLVGLFGLALGTEGANHELSSTNAPATKLSFSQKFKDSTDGKLDFSEFVGSARGFLPIPIIVTEPAVGFGGGLTLVFLHDSIKNRAELARQKAPDGTPKRIPPPSVSGLAGFVTENGSWGAGAFHLGIWKDDSIRYIGALGYAAINYDLYLQKNVVPVNVAGLLFLQQVIFRMGESDFFMGANYRLSSATAKRTNTLGFLPPPAGDGMEVVSAGVSPILEYDSRDNIFTPNRGYNAKVEWSHYDEWLGGDNRFDLLTVNNRVWFPLSKSWVLGLRLDGDFSDGEIPFYMLPFVNLRGIPAMRYQGKHVLTTEAELRWDFTPRWSMVGFAGAGWTSHDSFSNLGENDIYPAGGFGFRYLIARVFNLRSGIDLGFSEEGQSVYFITGSAWGW